MITFLKTPWFASIIVLSIASIATAAPISLGDELDVGGLNNNQTVDRTILSTSHSDFDGINDTFDGVFQYKFTVTYDATDGNGEFAALQLYNGGSQNLGITNNFNSGNWSYFRAAFNSGNEADLLNAGDNTVPIVAGVPQSFIVTINYVSGGNDSATVTFAGKTTDLPDGQYSFNNMRVRARNAQVDFTDISFEFNPIPEPASVALLASGVMLIARRRR